MRLAEDVRLSLLEVKNLRLLDAVRPALVCGLVATLCACSDDSSGSSSDGTTGMATAGSGGSGGSGGSSSAAGGAGGGASCTASEVACTDAAILTLDFQADPAPGEITSTPDGAGWSSTIDATAGGAFGPDPHSYVYGRFGDAGLEKVAISDEASLDSMDWDIALRRYVARVNSGNSGPSCVAAAEVPGTPGYDRLTAVPDGLSYAEDEYFDASCQLVPDGSGLESSPATALSGYWTYPGCVSMTGRVFILSLADGRRVKLVVTHYYDDAAQEQCDTTGMVPMTGSGAANIRMRWSFLWDPLESTCRHASLSIL